MPQKPSTLEYGVDEKPPALHVALLGLQYALLNSVYLILVVIIVRAAGASPEVSRSAVSLGMIAVAISTVLQALKRGPVGSGFLAPPVFSAIYLGPSVLAAKLGGMPAVLAMTVFAGLVEVGLSMILGRLRLITQPMITGLIVCVVGLQLGLVGLQQSFDVAGIGSPDLLNHFAVSMVTLATAIGLTVWGTGVWRLVCSLGGLVVGAVAAGIAGIYEPDILSRIGANPVFAIPSLSYISFDFVPELVPAFLAAGVAATLRSVGVLTTCQRANDADWVAPDFTNIRKGVLADGLGCTIGGLLGAPGMSTGPSLVGVSIATGVTSRVVAFACAGVLAVLAFVPRVSAAFLELPMSIAGPLLVFTASIMVTSGIQLMSSRFLDNRSVFVIGIGVLMAMVGTVNHAFFEQLPAKIRTFTESSLSLSLSVAIVLTLMFRIKAHRKEIVGWKDADELLDDLRMVFRKRARDWRLSEKLIQRCMANAGSALRLLEEGHFLQETVSIVATREDTSLDIELRYKGLPVSIPDIRTSMTDNTEEAPATAGMSAIGTGVYPDRSSTIAHGPDVILRLSFDA
jgi:xanthine permease XanP